jgi:uncharacterized protein
LNETEAIDLLLESGCSQDVIEHCRAVAQYARTIALNINACAQKKGKNSNINTDLVFMGGLLHDVGRSRTHGILHAVEGAKMASEKGLEENLVNIIERHIGAGIPVEEAKAIGLPEKDYMPITIEEKIVAHADNLIFGTKVATLEELVDKLQKRKLDEKVIQRIIRLNDEICSMMC